MSNQDLQFANFLANVCRELIDEKRCWSIQLREKTVFCIVPDRAAANAVWIEFCNHLLDQSDFKIEVEYQFQALGETLRLKAFELQPC